MRRLWSLGVQTLGEERDEGRVEGAFGEQAPEHVGHAEADEEGVGDGRGAEHGGDQHVADEAEHAAHDSHPADGGEPAIKLHGALSCARSRDPAEAGERYCTEASADSWRATRTFVNRSRIRDLRVALVIFLPVRSVT